METTGMPGGAKACVTSASIVLGSLTERTSSRLSTLFYASCKKQQLNPRTSHLSASRSPFHLSSYFPTRLHAAESRNCTRCRCFPPHSVASSERVEEETYVMIKPDGVQRGLVGEVISRFEKKGFKLTGLKLFQYSKQLAEEHYKDLEAMYFFPKLIDYMTSGPVVCMAWQGVGVVACARKLIGQTNPLESEPGTIRGDLAAQMGRRVVHGSHNPENGKHEIGLWFEDGELCQWTPAQEPWLRE